MKFPKPISIEKSGAFVEVFTLQPTGAGVLNGLTFAVKDLIDIKGKKTGCGNPTWRDTHPEPRSHAVCVEQLLIAGARCIGKTVTDELAFSLMGENHFYGTPLNPEAPDPVPGGSSSGSASAVACGLADFAIGTDTGGSVRIPASNCGIFGFRPSHGLISVAGVNPLSPSLDTVGVFASKPDVLARAALVLLGASPSIQQQTGRVLLIREAFSLCDPEVRQALEPSIQLLRELFGNRLREISIREIDGETEFSDLKNWNEIYRVLQRAEAESCLGGWVAANNPTFGTLVAESFELMRTVDRSLIFRISERRSKYFERTNAFLDQTDLICIPTAPSPAPRKGAFITREGVDGYYARTLSLTSIAGVARLPQVSIPVGHVAEAPIGLSLVARNCADAFLLNVIEKIGSTLQASTL